MNQDQQEELEALSFIYPDEFELLSPNSCRIQINWDFIEEIPNSQDLQLFLRVEFPLEYPDIGLHFYLENPKEITESDLSNLNDHLILKIKEFIGLAMVFNLIEFIKVDLIEIIKDRILKEIEKETEQVIIEKRVGTRVTVESFQNWKSNFSNEISQLLSKNLQLSIAQYDFAIIHKLKESEKKVTGRQLFEKDVSLAMTDLKLVDESEGVSVDLSLFKGLQGLDLEDSEENSHVLALLSE